VKVRFARTLSEVTPTADRSVETWLTMGTTYVVLAVGCPPERPPYFRLLTDDGMSEGAFDTRCFDVVDDRLSTRWRIRLDTRGHVEFAPAAWLTPGFWERFYGDIPFDGSVANDAADTSGQFYREVAAIIAEANQATPGMPQTG
jgi:hypothetical protein